MRKLGWWVVAAFAGTGALAACGGDDQVPAIGGDAGEDAADAGGVDSTVADATSGDAAETDATLGGDSGSDATLGVDAGSDATSGADADDGSSDAANAADAADAADADAGSDAGPYDAGPPTPGANLAVGFGVACAIDASGALQCWGGGTQLTPATVASGTTWKEIAAGRAFCGLQTNGSLWCWSQGAQPSQPDTNTFIHVAAGDEHDCAITTTGALYCWGDNNWGELGVGDTGSHTGLVRVGSDSDWAQVSAGSGHTCAIKQSGALFCWGNDTWGQVGDSSSNDRVTSPTAILPNAAWKEVSAGDDATCAIRSDGVLFCWGTLGNSSQYSTPMQIDTATDWAHTSSHGTHDCSLKTNGALYCFGADTYGQLGDGTTTGSSKPELIAAGTTWSDVAAGEWSTCARKASDGSVWCWGAATSGQLGVGAPYGPHYAPTQVGAAGAWKSVSAANETACGVRSDGTIACWGLVVWFAPSGGFLAQSPVTVDTGTSWDTVGVTASTGMCARQTDGSLWCKNGSAAFTSTGLKVASFVANESHTCAVTTAQALYCWGSNAQGQVGLPIVDGGTNTVATPTQIGSATWLAVSADWASTCAVRTDGTTWCWGNGNPTMTQIGSSAGWTMVSSENSPRYGVNGGGLFNWTGVNAPAQVGAATDWRNAVSGSSFMCGTKTGGSLWCYGSNYSGQLGDGTTTTRSSPVQIGSATNWSYAVAGSSFTCGLRADGTLYCWGDDTWATIGDGTAWIATPTQVIP